MKITFLKTLKSITSITAITIAVIGLSGAMPAPKHKTVYKTVTVSAPFPMEPIKEYVFPARDFPINKYGAVADGKTNNSKAIARAIAACNRAGGGRVVIPAGEWLTGPIHLKSNVNLHLSENAILRFTDNPQDYLPAVMTSWEGMECYNYSPLVYALDCENIAITGTGTLQPIMDTWRKWFKRPQAHMNALAELYTMASTNVPVEERQMAKGENNLRPHLIHFNRCKNVLLDQFKIRESPFWTIHLYMCDGGIVRNLDVRAHGHNNDGVDLEMSRNFLVENCKFDQGDDAVVIKAGRNQDAWRLETPCENIVIRNCDIIKGHTLLGIGSEMSGGIRNVYMHDCAAPDSVFRLFFAKTNHRRGGFIENIHMENVKAGKMQRIMEVDTDVLYQWRNQVPTYEERITKIDGLYMNNIVCERTEAIYDLKGDAKLPTQNVSIKNVHVGEVTKFIKNVQHTENVVEENVTYDRFRNAANAPAYDYSKLQKEKLGRGVVAIRETPSDVVVSWRYLSSDPENTAFNIYRNGKKLAEVDAHTGTFYRDTYKGKKAVTYTVRPIVDGVETGNVEGSYTLPAQAPIGYINIPLDVPADGTTPAGQKYTYTPNDASIGDVDGDGEYEIILKWDPSNAHDNAHDGYTGNVFFDCYRLTGERLWRIDMGRNVRAGAHYTQFMVYDFDGDGRAEIVMKTSDGTVDGQGKVIGDATADYREPGKPVKHQGRILTGNEIPHRLQRAYRCGNEHHQLRPRAWQTGRLGRRPCQPERPFPGGSGLSGWHPSERSDVPRILYPHGTRRLRLGREGAETALGIRQQHSRQQHLCRTGNHNLRVADVDGDGCDEIIYGSCAIDNNGKGLHSTQMGHGDAIHLTKFSPDMKGFQVWDCHENKRDGSSFRDAATGEVLFQVKSPTDVGRCMAADIDPTNLGVEMWSWESKGLRNIKGEVINPNIKTFTVNMAVWWDGDLLRELLDKNFISKYDWQTGTCHKLTTFTGAASNNGTKANPCLQGDLIGDWREEVLLRSEDNQSLRLYVSPIATDYRFHTFLEDPVYRISIATQNVAYNQPTQPGFYFGPDLKGKFRGYTFK